LKWSHGAHILLYYTNLVFHFTNYKLNENKTDFMHAGKQEKYTHLYSIQKFSCMVFPSGASVSVWIFCNSCKWVPQLSSVWKDGSQNNTVIVGKGSNTQKC